MNAHSIQWKTREKHIFGSGVVPLCSDKVLNPIKKHFVFALSSEYFLDSERWGRGTDRFYDGLCGGFFNSFI